MELLHCYFLSPAEIELRTARLASPWPRGVVARADGLRSACMSKRLIGETVYVIKYSAALASDLLPQLRVHLRSQVRRLRRRAGGVEDGGAIDAEAAGGELGEGGDDERGLAGDSAGADRGE